jgi:hypothetical protein
MKNKFDLKEEAIDLIESIKYSLPSFVRRVKRLIRYIPVIWNSYDFDYRYATELFRMKLEDIADFMESDRAMSVSAKEDAKRIRTAIKLMDKVYDEVYNVEYQDKLKELYGEDVNDIEFVDYIDDDGKKYYRIKRKYEDWDNCDEIKEMETKLFKESQLKQNKAHRLLWKYIEHNIQRWWD